MTWGDGSTTAFTGHPDTLLTQTHNYASYGLKTIRVDAVQDSKGRDMGGAVTRSVNVSWLPIVCLDDLVLTQ